MFFSAGTMHVDQGVLLSDSFCWHMLEIRFKSMNLNKVLSSQSMFESIDSLESISLLDYTNPDNYVYYGIAAAGVLLLIILIIMKKKGSFEKIKKVCSSNASIMFKIV